MKTNLFGLFQEEIKTKITALQFQPYRAAQLTEWLYRRGVGHFSAMTNLPQVQREKLQ